MAIKQDKVEIGPEEEEEVDTEIPASEEQEEFQGQPIESNVEYAEFLTTPAASATFADITKDNVLSYLKDTEVDYVTLNSGTIELLEQYHFLETKKIIISEIATLLATARSRSGFAAKLLVTQITEGKKPEDKVRHGTWITPVGRRGF